MTNVLLALLLACAPFAAATPRALATETEGISQEIRLDAPLDRATFQAFALPIAEVRNIDDANLIEVSTISSDASSLLIVGRTIGRAQVLVRLRGESDFISLMITIVDPDMPPADVTITVGRSAELPTGKPLSDVYLDAEAVAQVRLSPQDSQTLRIFGKTVGWTVMTLRFSDGSEARKVINVLPPAPRS